MLTFGTVKTSILTVCLTLPNADKLATLCVWGALDLWQHNDVVSSSALVTFLPGFSVGNPPPPLAIVNVIYSRVLVTGSMKRFFVVKSQL
jgi:hypothetical protein